MIPSDTQALIGLPLADPDLLTERGNPIREADGVQIPDASDLGVDLLIGGSGRYQFSITK